MRAEVRLVCEILRAVRQRLTGAGGAAELEEALDRVTTILEQERRSSLAVEGDALRVNGRYVPQEGRDLARLMRAASLCELELSPRIPRRDLMTLVGGLAAAAEPEAVAPLWWLALEKVRLAGPGGSRTLRDARSLAANWAAVLIDGLGAVPPEEEGPLSLLVELVAGLLEVGAHREALAVVERLRASARAGASAQLLATRALSRLSRGTGLAPVFRALRQSAGAPPVRLASYLAALGSRPALGLLEALEREPQADLRRWLSAPLLRAVAEWPPALLAEHFVALRPDAALSVLEVAEEQVAMRTAKQEGGLGAALTFLLAAGEHTDPGVRAAGAGAAQRLGLERRPAAEPASPGPRRLPLPMEEETVLDRDSLGGA